MMVNRETKTETRARSRETSGGKREPVRARLLGGFSARVGDRTVERDEWRLRKAAALVKLLALAPDHRLHREWIMDRLWPHLGPKAASNNLRRTLHAARNAIDPNAGSSYLASEEEQLILCPGGPLWVDVEAFEAAATTARREREPAAYRAALDLYPGELLPEDRYEDWAEDRRQKLRRLNQALLAELADIYEDRSEHEAAIDALVRLTTEEPAHEEAQAGLMRLYSLSGRQSEALRQFEILEGALARELGTEPNASSRALREEIASGTFSPLADETTLEDDAAARVGKHNLPAPRTSFVGREREVVEAKRALSMTRILTLTGAAGSGKTRLALEVARDLVGAYSDGVWLVELAPLAEGALVPKAVAEAFGVPERQGESLADTLAESLRARQALLILDNCEHLVEAAARLVDDLLDACPHLRVLATSREPLGVAGELNWQVPSLSVPDERTSTVEEVEGYESTRLFVVRASYRSRGFSITPSNARAVAKVCRRLAGIPLAIELAAARVGPLSPEQIANRLDDSIGLLTGGDRMAVPRHRTLQGALDWSYELLGEQERALFRRLAVFAGGWTLEAAEAVGAAGSVLDLLSGLVTRSLVFAESTDAGDVRYTLLEPVRQYAQEKLEDSGEAEAASRRHAEYFVALAEEAEPELVGPRQVGWFARLDAEHDNVRAALSWALEQGEAELGLRLAGALRPFWLAQGYFSEGRRWLEELLAVGESSVAARVKALVTLGWLADWQEDMNRAEAAAEEGLRQGVGAEIESDVTASLLGVMGDVALVRGDYARAKEWFEEGLAICRENGNKRESIWLLGGLSNLALEYSDYRHAKELFDEALTVSRELGDALTLGTFLNGLGYVHLLEGDYQRAMTMSEEAVTLLRERGYRGILTNAIDTLAWAALLGGDHERASALHREGLTLCKDLNDRATAAAYFEALACEVAVTGEGTKTATLIGVAETLREASSFPLVDGERAMHEPYLRAARSGLDHASWQAAFAEGQAMTFEEAVEYALSAEAPAFSSSLVLDQPSPEARPLTRREREVAALVARGLTNRQIASELVISEHTARQHVKNILKKLGLHSREQVVSRLHDQ
jgi:predicted ATPase/DNA-binding SARP family transcriptional activator/DNA-binding CsgD family transcriptional regulator